MLHKTVLQTCFIHSSLMLGWSSVSTGPHLELGAKAPAIFFKMGERKVLYFESILLIKSSI